MTAFVHVADTQLIYTEVSLFPSRACNLLCLPPPQLFILSSSVDKWMDMNTWLGTEMDGKH